MENNIENIFLITCKKNDNYVDSKIKLLHPLILTSPSQDDLNQLYFYLTDKTNVIRTTEAYHLFMEFLLKFDTKINGHKSIRNKFLDKVTKSHKDYKVLVTLLIDYIKVIYIKFEMGICSIDLRELKLLLSTSHIFINICRIESSSKLVASWIIPLYVDMSLSFINQILNKAKEMEKFNLEIVPILEQFFSQLITLFSKHPDLYSDQYILKLIYYTNLILNSDKISFDLKTKSGMILVHCFLNLPESEKINFSYDYAVLELTKNPINNQWIQLGSLNLNKIVSEDSLIILYSCLFKLIPIKKQLDFRIRDNVVLYEFLFKELIFYSRRSMENSLEIVEISRSLFSMSQMFNRLTPSIFSAIFLDAYNYCHSFYEFHINVVRKNTDLFLSNFINEACFYVKKGDYTFVNYLVDNLKINLVPKKIDFLIVNRLCSNENTYEISEKFNNFNINVLKLIYDPSLTEEVTKTYEILMEYFYKKLPFNDWYFTWILPVKQLLNSVDSELIIYINEILSKAFELDQNILRELFPLENIGNYREWSAMLKCLSLVRKLKLSYDSENNEDFWLGLIEKEKLELFIRNRDQSVRLNALKLIVDCQKTTEIYTNWELKILHEFYLFNSGTQSACMRKQLLTAYKKGLERYFAGREVIKRHVKDTTNEEIIFYRNAAKYYSNFFNEFYRLLLLNITSNTNCYQRTSALELLAFTEPLMNKTEWYSIWTKNDIENLKNIFFDNFEENKKFAIAILRSFKSEHLLFNDAEYAIRYFDDAVKLCYDTTTGNPLSACYMFEIFSSIGNLSKICRKIDLVKCRDNVALVILKLNDHLTLNIKENQNDLYKASETAPLYGLLQAIRHLIKNRDQRLWCNSYEVTFNEVLRNCKLAFEIVVPIISDPTQEGYISENIIFDNFGTVRSQSLLVYAWRTMKETIFLFSEIAKQSINSSDMHTDKYDPDLIEIGNYFLRLFIEAKHRGVFEQAFVGFCDICDSYWRSKEKNLNVLPLKWLNEALDFCLGKKTDDKLCSTRRSAGLPFMIMGIIINEPTVEKKSFHFTMKTLIDTLKEENASNEDSQIHCFNVLRIIFRNSKLGEMVVPYTDKSVVAALKGMSSGSWRIRNSSTLLFSALITRIFGVERIQDCDRLTGKNKLTLKIFFMRYPLLFNFLMEVLKSEVENKGSLLLYPVLLILSKLYPCLLDEMSSSKLEHFIGSIGNFLGHTSYDVRKLAARASLSFMISKGLNNYIEHNFSIIGNLTGTNNEIHGILMQTWYILKFFTDEINLSVNEIIKKTYKIMLLVGKKISFNSIALYMDIISLLLTRYSETIQFGVVKNILKIIAILFEGKAMTAQSDFKKSMFNLSTTIMFHCLNSQLNTKILEKIINTFLKDNRKVRNYALFFILYVNISYRKQYYNVHPLLTTQDIEISEEIQFIVDNFSNDVKRNFLIQMHDSVVGLIYDELDNASFEEENIIIYLLVDYYPCICSKLLDNGWKFNDFLNKISSCNDEVGTSIISFIGLLLSNVGKNSTVDYGTLVCELNKDFFNELPIHRRLVLAEIIVSIKNVIVGDADVLDESNFFTIMEMVMSLYMDEEIEVRNTISILTDELNDLPNHQSGWQTFPERSKLLLLQAIKKKFSRESYISFIFSWGLRYFPDFTEENTQVENQISNFYFETVSLTEIIGSIINENVWNSEQICGKFDCKTTQYIFVTDLLLRSLRCSRFNNAVNLKVKEAVIEFLGNINANLKTDDFQTEKFFVGFETEVKCLQEKLERKYFTPVVRLLYIVYKNALM